MANSVNYRHFETLLNAYEKAYPQKYSMTLFCIVFLVSLCCSFKKINMFSFQ